jgi:uncharacterized tellurite resistance protein B-like protein
MTPSIWSKPFYRTVSGGEFYCPKCQRQRPFDREHGRWWFTLYGSPLLPLLSTDSRIVCHHCREVFGEYVLFQGPEESAAVFARGLRDLLLRLILADGSIDDEEIAALKTVYQQTIGCELADIEIRKSLESLAQSNVTMVDQCQRIAPRLTEAAKEAIVRGAFLVASACGELSPKKLAQLRELAPALGLPEETFRRIIEEAP